MSSGSVYATGNNEYNKVITVLDASIDVRLSLTPQLGLDAVGGALSFSRRKSGQELGFTPGMSQHIPRRLLCCD